MERRYGGSEKGGSERRGIGRTEGGSARRLGGSADSNRKFKSENTNRKIQFGKGKLENTGWKNTSREIQIGNYTPGKQIGKYTLEIQIRNTIRKIQIG